MAIFCDTSARPSKRSSEQKEVESKLLWCRMFAPKFSLSTSRATHCFCCPKVAKKSVTAQFHSLEQDVFVFTMHFQRTQSLHHSCERGMLDCEGGRLLTDCTSFITVKVKQPAEVAISHVKHEASDILFSFRHIFSLCRHARSPTFH